VLEVIDAVERGGVDLGFVPIENMIEGSVTATLDALAFESDLLVQREVDLPISLDLCVRPGTKLRDVAEVVSIPIATAQARGFLHRKLPDAALRAANSTAEAARTVARSRRAGRAAVCNPLAARLYGLDVLAADIADHPENQTRFVLLGRGVPAPTGHDKTSIVCFQRANRPGSLLAILQEFAARAIDLNKLESRPTKQSLGDYCFFIDCDGHVADELLADALRNVVAKHAEVKFLGSYPVGGPHAATLTRRRAASKRWKEASAWVDDLRSRVRGDARDDGAAPGEEVTP
jgi:prephenate dehydratase